jgi:hypothetical protein
MMQETTVETREVETRAQRLRKLAKDHPGTTLMAAAGASALLAGEFALGAMLGAGAALLMAKKTGPETRRELEARGRQLLASAKELPRRLTAHQQPEMPPPPPAP